MISRRSCRNFSLPVVTVVIVLLVIWPPNSGAEPAIDGASLYQKFCSACHGENGDAQSRVQRALNPSPRNFTDPSVWESLTYERMISAVADGRPGTAMVGWKNRLTDKEIDTIVAYIRKTFMHKPESTDTLPGKKIYTEHCAVCHGDNGNSAMWTKTSLNPPPRDFTSAMASVELSRERMITSVTYGRPGTAMMSFRKRLDGQQVAAVVDYIRAAFMHGNGTAQPPQAGIAPYSGPGQEPAGSSVPASSSRDADMTLPFPNGLVGDVVSGGRFFQNNCYVCHGREGNGRGPRADFLYPKPRNFIHPDSRRRLNRPALFAAISRGRTGSVMPSWNKVLSEQQIADVAEYVFQTFIKGPQSEKESAPVKKNVP